MLSNHDTLIVLDWGQDKKSSQKARERLLQDLRNAEVTTPVLIVGHDISRWVPSSRAQIPNDSEVPGDGCCVVPEGELVEPDRVAEAFAKLGISLPRPSLRLEVTHNSLETASLLNWIGEEQLTLIVQKFFPGATVARIWPVGGGGGDGLGLGSVRSLLKTLGESSHFLKFFPRPEEQSGEIAKHDRAKAWLGSLLVGRATVPDLENEDSAQNQAFSSIHPCHLPRVLYIGKRWSTAVEKRSRRSTRRRVIRSLTTPCHTCFNYWHRGRLMIRHCNAAHPGHSLMKRSPRVDHSCLQTPEGEL